MRAVMRDTLPPPSGHIKQHLHRTSRTRSTLQWKVLKTIHATTLNLEDLSNDTWPPLNITCATLLNIFGVVGRNNVLPCLGVVHHGLLVREKFIEAPIEEAGSNERVDIADGETVQIEILAVFRSSYAEHRLTASI
jgi:hypothetical protein